MTLNAHFIHHAETLYSENIHAHDWTLDELIDFADFVDMLDKAYNHSSLQAEFGQFRRDVSRYENMLNTADYDEISDDNSETVHNLNVEFMVCKLDMEDIVSELLRNPYFNKLYS